MGETLLQEQFIDAFLNLDSTYLDYFCLSYQNYTVLTKGETISIKYLENYYYIDVMECEPADTIHITNSDINLDFDEPLDYVEPPPKEPSPPPSPPPIKNTVIPRSALPALHRDKPIKTMSDKFVPFSGSGHRLGSK